MHIDLLDNFVFFQNFNSYLFAGDIVGPELDFTKSTFADCLSYQVMPDALGLVFLLFLPTFIAFGMMPIFGSGCWSLIFLLFDSIVRFQSFCLVFGHDLLFFYNVLILDTHRDLPEGVHDLRDDLLGRLVELGDSGII